jgi:hypothetical protein
VYGDVYVYVLMCMCYVLCVDVVACVGTGRVCCANTVAPGLLRREH